MRRWLAASLAAAAFLGWLWLPPLSEPDEARWAEMGREILETGDWTIPRLLGRPYLAKPPLYPWLEAASLRLLGPKELAARLPAALASLAGAWLLFAAGERLWGRAAGLWASVCFCSCLYGFAVGRFSTPDPLVSLAIGAATLGLWFGLREGRRWLVVGSYAVSGIGFLAKGLIGVLFPLGTVGGWLALRRRWRDLRGLACPWGLLVLSVLVLPWPLAAEHRCPGFLHRFLLEEHLLRYLTGWAHRERPWWIYPPMLAVGLLPFSALAPQLLRAMRSEEAGFLGWWALAVVAFYTLSRSKLATYVLPALYPLCLLMGGALAGLEGERPWRTTRLLALLGGGALLAGLGAVGWRLGPFPPGRLLLPGAFLVVWAGAALGARRVGEMAGWLCLAALGFLLGSVPLQASAMRDRSCRPLARRVERLAVREVVQYRLRLFGLPFYLQRSTPRVPCGSCGCPGVPPRGCLGEAALRRLWRPGSRLLAVVRRRHLPAFRRRVGGVRVMGSWRGLCLVAPR